MINYKGKIMTNKQIEEKAKEKATEVFNKHLNMAHVQIDDIEITKLQEWGFTLDDIANKIYGSLLNQVVEQLKTDNIIL